MQLCVQWYVLSRPVRHKAAERVSCPYANFTGSWRTLGQCMSILGLAAALVSQTAQVFQRRSRPTGACQCQHLFLQEGHRHEQTTSEAPAAAQRMAAQPPSAVSYCLPVPWAAPLVLECMPCDTDCIPSCNDLTACLYALQAGVMGA